MPKLITNQKDIADAETADLLYTLNELEGTTVKKFATRAIGERRVAMAIMAAEDRAGHRGTAKNVKPKAEDGKVDHGPSNKRIAAVVAAEKPQADPMDTVLGAELTKTAAAASAKVKKDAKGLTVRAKGERSERRAVETPKEPKEPKAPRGDTLVTMTDAAITVEGIRPDSFRGKILASIVAAGPKGITKKDLVAKHELYTADVVCKFKRLGLLTETAVS